MARKRLFCAALAFTLLALGTSLWGETLNLPATSAALITTPLNPNNYVASGNPAYAGVAKLIITMPGGTYGCSGSLLMSGWDILTAAHCISDGSNGANPTVLSLTAIFPDGTTVSGAGYFLPPGWTGDFEGGADIGVIRLANQVAIPGYTLYSGPNPWNGTIDVAGYGLSGLGTTGVTGPFGTLRAGQNSLDPVTWEIPGNPYAWDFDSGLPANDTLCLLVGFCNTGLGALEVMIASGDSGGPTMFSGMLLGVHSFGATFGMGGGDIDGLLNSSFGELAGDTRVLAYSEWINSVVVPEPATMLLLGTGLSALALRRRRKG